MFARFARLTTALVTDLEDVAGVASLFLLLILGLTLSGAA